MIIISHGVVRPALPEALGPACYYTVLELLCVKNAGPASVWLLWESMLLWMKPGICAVVGGAQRIPTHMAACGA